MKAATDRLRSHAGASVVLAMIVFLIIVLLCASIVTIGLSNAKNAWAGQASEQDYLSVKSAAVLVRRTVEADVSIPKAYTGHAAYGDEAVPALFKELMNAKNTDDTDGLTQTMTVSVSVPAAATEDQTAAAGKLKQVEATFSMSPAAGDYDVTVFYLAGDGLITMKLSAEEDSGEVLTWIAKSVG